MDNPDRNIEVRVKREELDYESMEETMEEIGENVVTPQHATADLNIVLSRIDRLEGKLDGKMDAINETLKLLLEQHRIFGETSAKIIAEQKRVGESIKTIDDRFNFLVRGVEAQTINITEYFPVKTIETLEELRKKSQEDINFIFALRQFFAKVERGITLEEQIDNWFSDKVCKRAYPNDRERNNCVLMKIMKDTWVESLKISEEEFRLAWTQVLKKQSHRKLRQMKEREGEEDDEKVSDAPENLIMDSAAEVTVQQAKVKECIVMIERPMNIPVPENGSKAQEKVPTCAKILTKQKKAKVMKEKIKVVAQSESVNVIEISQLDIGHYFPVKKLETLLELRLKCRKDTKFKLALMEFFTKVEFGITLEKQIAIWFGVKVCSKFYPHFRDRKKCVLLKIMQNAWRQSLQTTEKEFRLAWRRAVKNQIGRLDRLKKKGRDEEELETFSKAFEKRSSRSAANISVREIKVEESILTMDDSSNCPDNDQINIEGYFPVTNMETLEDLRRKSQEDKNFKSALKKFFGKPMERAMTLEKQIDKWFSDELCLAEYLHVGDRRDCVLLQTMKDSWSESMSVTEMEFRSVWRRAIKNQNARLYRKIKKTEEDHEDDG